MLEGKPGTELCSGSSLADEVGKKLMEFPQLAQLGERRLPSSPQVQERPDVPIPTCWPLGRQSQNRDASTAA